MSYLSPSSFEKLSPYLLIVQPYKEAKHNIFMTIHGRRLTFVKRTQHLCAAILLSIPLINTLALLVLRSIYKEQKFRSRFKEKLFTPLLLGSANLKLLKDETQQRKEAPQKIAQLILNHLFEEYICENSPAKIDLEFKTGKLFAKYGDYSIELQEVLEHVDWAQLDKKWSHLDSKQIDTYLQNSLVFETLSKDKKAFNDSPFAQNSSFIRLYTSCGFYAFINPLLRQGQLNYGMLSQASAKTNRQLLHGNALTIAKVAKEILFIALMTAGNLNALPANYLAQIKVTRMAQIPRDILKEMQKNKFIIERGFLSASGPGGGYAGGGPCGDKSYRVKYSILSKKGKHVQTFSDLPENEVLFSPFSKFNLLNITGNEKTGYKIEMEES